MILNRSLPVLPLLLIVTAHAQETSDWKLLGFQGAKKDKQPPAMFYLANEIKRSPGSVQVWTKVLSGENLTKVLNTKPSDAVISSVTEKVKSDYQPPYVTLRKSSDSKERLMVISMEVLADASLVPPDVRMLWEFNCGESTYRVLSTVSDEGSAPPLLMWQPVPPESLIHDLATLTCKKAT
jgi:hypothetical protein